MLTSYSTRSTRLVLAAAVVSSVLLAGAALADKPAVKRLNGRVFGGYAYDRIAQASVTEGGSSAFVPATTERGWGLGGALTIPVFHRFGTRLVVSGGMADFEQLSAPGFTGSQSDGAHAGGGVDFFVRDPDAAYINLGYRFGWEDPADGSSDAFTTNSVVVDVGIFIPDQGMGPVDWNASFVYGRSKRSSTGFSDEVNDYSGLATAGWYLTEYWRFTAGFRWSLEAPQVSLPSRDLRGTASLDWLLPFAERRFVTARFEGTGGRVRNDLAAPLSVADRTAWSVGGSLTFSYPGATSLIELTRELH